jgi:uncharacterized protein YacL
MTMQKIVKVMFSFVFSLFGGLCGYSIALYTQSYYNTLSQMGRATNFAAFILLGFLLGLTLAPLFTRGALTAVDAFAVSLQRLSVQEVLMGSAGLLFGLIIAFFVNLALRQIDFSSIPAVGTYVGPFLIVVSTIFLALLGAFFGSRLVFIHSFAELLQSGIGQRNWGDQIFVVDTSVIIDGRLSEIVDTGFISGTLVVSRFVLDEIQAKADSAKDSERMRGRRPAPQMHRQGRAAPLSRPQGGGRQTGATGPGPAQSPVDQRLQPAEGSSLTECPRAQHQRPGQSAQAGVRARR